MIRVHELEAWSRPGQLLYTDYGKTVLQPKLWKKGIPKNVFIGTTNIPDPAHCRDLKVSIRSGELKGEDFELFCVTNGFAVSIESEESACKFLEYVRGTCLAWIHLPENDEVNLLPKIKRLLKVHGHIVVDPDNGNEMV